MIRSKERPSVYDDLCSATKISLFTLEKDLIIAHVEVEANRENSQPFAYVQSKHCQKSYEAVLRGLLEEAYKWACEQRLIKFFICATSSFKLVLNGLNYHKQNIPGVKALIEGNQNNAGVTTLLCKFSKNYLRDRIWYFHGENEKEPLYSNKCLDQFRAF